MMDLIKTQLTDLNIANNIIEILFDLMNKNGLTGDVYMEELDKSDKEIILEILCEISKRAIINFENKTETIQILKYYLEISKPTKSCSRLLNRIINSDTHILNKFNITVKDIDNDYIWLLYYLVYANLIDKI